ncbi:MAG: hypothetical protein V4480_02555 [Patescibacteria group bacterium]
MKVKQHISGGDTRCVQAAFRMVVETLTGKDPGAEAADQMTGYIEGRGTWQFKMLLAFASYGFEVVDYEKMNVRHFVADPEGAIRAQVGDEESAQGILMETDLLSEKEALKGCLELPQIQFIESIPSFEDLEQEVKLGKLALVNVNLRMLQNTEGREGHMLIVEEITDDEVIVDDPGPDGGLRIAIGRSLFRRAWTSPSEAMANFISVTKP